LILLLYFLIMSDESFSLPDFLRDAYILAGERETLCKNQPACPDCRSHQVQLIDVGLQQWRCRHYGLVDWHNGVGGLR
jgi:hypothetical protein